MLIFLSRLEIVILVERSREVIPRAAATSAGALQQAIGNPPCKDAKGHAPLAPMLDIAPFVVIDEQ